jgi:hypothetical protein
MSKNCQVMEQAFHTVIEKAFHSAPSELLYLKKGSYGYANLCLAWKALQSRERDYNLVLHFQQETISPNPQLRFSWEYIRLSLAIATLQWFGQKHYGKVLTLIYDLRRRISNAAR